MVKVFHPMQHNPTVDIAAIRAQGPTALRVMLGTQLRRLREARGITAGAAGHAIRASHAKISRMERGRVGFKERDVADLLTLYGITDQQQRRLFLVLAQQSNIPGWWHKYSDILPDWFETYLGLEQASAVIRCYEPHLVPGLLQTQETARAIIRLDNPDQSTEDTERRVALRAKRQEILTRPGAPALWAVIEETALWQSGRRRALRAQIQHLIKMTELPNVTLQIIPLFSGLHIAIGGPFTILRFTEPDLPDIVYLEQLTSALYLDKIKEVEHYQMVMNRLCVQAQSPTETIKLLNGALKVL
jgi:transcriptional regulator with XRE-family HTH domain